MSRVSDDQLSLFEQPAAPAAPPAALAVTWQMLHLGAVAGPKHAVVELRAATRAKRDAAPIPPDVVARMLDLAERALRYNQAPHPRLDATKRGQAGSNGPMGIGELMADSKGIHGRAVEPQIAATWPQLLAGLRAQRQEEPEVARLRDLAEGYHYLDYYGSVYASQPVSGEWRGDRLIEAIARDVIELGGDPTLLTAHTEYMAAGIAAAIA